MDECERIAATLEEYLHGELSPRVACAVREHLAACDNCNDERRVVEAIIDVVRRAAAPAPTDVRAAVLERVRAAHPPRPRWPRHWSLRRPR